MADAEPTGWMRRKGMVLAAAGAVALLALVLWMRAGGEEESDAATFVVRRGPLVIDVTESGTIRALDQRIIKSEVEGQTTIIQLVEEGARVQEGDLLVQLDASKLEDAKVDQQIKVQNAEAAFVRAREQLEVVKSQNASDQAKADLDARFAAEDLVRYREGEYPNQLKETESKVALAEEELKRAADKFDWSKRLFEEKYLSETEYRADELAFKRSDLDHELAGAALSLLKDYTHPRRLIELESEIEQKDMAQERVRRKATADFVQAEADLKAKQAEYQQQQEKLRKIEDQIGKTEILAPVAGMVVYATSAQPNWRGNNEPLDEGQVVRERQELIHLPTADSMMAEVKVHESALEHVSVGLPATIRVDALSARRFTGRVARIAPLPDAQSVWMNPDLKVYTTTLHIDGASPELRTGMSCEVSILVVQFDDAVYVPVQTVVRQGGQHVVYVRHRGAFEPRAVVVGPDNNIMIQVKEGLEEGEEVLLTPPLDGGDSADGSPAVEVPAAPEASAVPAATPAPETPAATSGEESSRREEMRKRFQNLSEEERRKLREQYRGSESGTRESSAP